MHMHCYHSWFLTLCIPLFGCSCHIAKKWDVAWALGRGLRSHWTLKFQATAAFLVGWLRVKPLGPVPRFFIFAVESHKNQWGTTGKKWWSNFQQGTRDSVSLKKNKAVPKFDPDSNERMPERVLGWTWVVVLTWAVLSCYSNGHCWLLGVVKPWTGNSHDAPESEDIWRARQQILTSTAKIRSHCTKFAGTARHLCETKTVALVWSQSRVLNIFGWRVESDFHRHPLETSWRPRRSIPGWFLERLESKWR